MQTPRLLLLLALIALPFAAWADSARLAVASNFAPTADVLAREYAADSGNQVEIIAGATGKLYAQIGAGAPYDGFLSADSVTVAKLEGAGTAVEGTGFSYAVGVLALWSADGTRDLSDPKAALLAASHVAIANPDLAPYGKAALEVIEKLGVSEEIAGKIVMGENVGQAQSLVASGAAEVGFIAAPNLPNPATGARWLVPSSMHAPLVQEAVLLRHGVENNAAKGFLAYLASPGARIVIAAAGYDLP